MIAIIIILISAIVFSIIINYISEYAFNKAFNKHKKTEEEAYAYLKNKNVLDLDIYKEVTREEVSLNSLDGILLKGYLIEKYPESNRYIILVHGYTANNHIDMSYVRFFIKEGFNVLLIDQRAHGNSQGTYPSYGYYEQDDVSRWINYLYRRKGEELFLGLHGQSLGGATVLMCGSKNDKVDFIIEDCGYSSGKEIIKYQIKLVKWIPLNSVYLVLNHKIKKRVGFSLNDVNPIKDIKKCKAPILFIHGDKDTCVPCSMAKKMYDVRKNKNDKLFIVPEADHMCAYSMKKGEYESICHEFIENAELIKNNRRK